MKGIKRLILILIAFGSVQSFAALHKSETSNASEQTQVYLKAFEIFHPEQKVAVADKDAPKEAVLEDLKRLEEILDNGAPYQAGDLIHLACSHITCTGGDCKECN